MRYVTQNIGIMSHFNQRSLSLLFFIDYTIKYTKSCINNTTSIPGIVDLTYVISYTTKACCKKKKQQKNNLLKDCCQLDEGW